ncbi:MAG: glycosyltransferase [Alphaproteobacteria bacterium]|nr:glycosyltransferase [Alphaproteobacteria bacterium]
MADPQIAVLMPIYNPVDGLKDCLDSLRAQTVPFRLFLVDDGSKTRPDYALLTQGIDCRIIILPKNLGITGAMNAGLAEILKGDFTYVSRWDYPDLSDPTRFAKQVAFLDAHLDYCMVGCATDYFYAQTGLTVPAKNPESYEACVKAMRYNAPLTHGAIMFRSSFWRELGQYTDQYPAAEDYAMECYAYSKGYKFGNLPETLYTTIEIQQSISVVSRAKQLKSRLRLQWRYFDWLSVHSYLGMLRTLLLRYGPVTLLRQIKSKLG